TDIGTSRINLSLHVPSSASPVAAESILVLLYGASLTIVVRDTTLSEQDALQGAFATASELTGQRAALNKLTLNGRTVYQHSEPLSVGSPVSAAWVLAC